MGTGVPSLRPTVVKPRASWAEIGRFKRGYQVVPARTDSEGWLSRYHSFDKTIARELWGA